MEDIILVGFGGHAKSVVDSIESSGIYHIVGYTDSEKTHDYHGYQCIGTDEVLNEYFKYGIHKAFIAVGYLGKGNLRHHLYERLKQIGFQIPAIIDPTAVVGRDVEIGEGVYIGKKAVINAGVRVEKMSIINTGAIVEHESSVGEFSHIAVGSILCGNVSIGKECLIGAGTVVIQGKKIDDRVIIGAGSVVLSHVPKGKTVYGVVKGTNW